MKKLRFFKALFVAAALALMIPGCSDVNSDEGTNIPQTQGNKVALKISASEGYRTALPTVDLTSYTYELTADEVTENTAANNPATLIPTGTSYADLTKANSVYVEADKTYLFALKATNGSSGDILSGTLTKAISASDSTLSFQLFAIDSTSDKGSVSIEVTYADGYGVASVVPTLHKMDGTSLATDYPLTYTAGDTAGTGTITGSVPVGASYVNVVLKDESSTEIGSLPQEAVYAVKGLTSSGTVNVQVKKYKATIALTTSDTPAPTLTLKNPAITTEGYAGISLTSSSETSPYTYTGYVPVGTYAIYIGDADEPVSGKQVTNTTEVSIDTSKSLTGITAALASGTYFTGTTLDELKKAITITGVYNDSSSETLGTADVLDGVTVECDEYSPTATTEQTLTVKYGEFEAVTVKVTLVEDYITEWSVALKDSVAYKEGNTPTAEDVVVKAKWASAPTTEVTLTSGYSVPDTALTTSDTVLTVTLTVKRGTGVDETKDVAITVEAVTPTTTIYKITFPKGVCSDSKKEFITDCSSLEKSGISVNGLEEANDSTTYTTGLKIDKNAYIKLVLTKESDLYFLCSGDKTLVSTADSDNGYSALTITPNVKSEKVSAGTYYFKNGTGNSQTNICAIYIWQSSSTPTPTPSTDTVTMGESSYTIDKTTTTTATATSANNDAITFASDNTNIFTVDASTGVMTPVNYGTATLTATSSQDVSATATVKVSRETPIESDTFDFRTGYMVSGTTESSFDYGVVSLTKAFLNGNQHGITINNTGTLSIKVAGPSAIYIGNESNGGGGTFTAVKTSDGTTDLTSKLSTTSYAKAASTISTSYTELNDTTKAACQILYYSGSEPATITLTMNAQAYFPVIFVEKYNPAYTPAITLTAVGSSDITLSYSNGTLTASAVSGATVAENGYKWYVDNALQSGSTSSTLDVSSLVSGIHSIVVTATDSDTKVEYAAQYVLTVQ
ncbi:hypothetical protein [Treponema sp.]|uniref:hypothetical protein n=1 Tax=Treponema sp. TaxID=166 RepID=UPI0025E65F7E|nr:hypothetical protein [Treponema sp.]MBR4321499.1 hypothetical protein [Treponema sp.]